MKVCDAVASYFKALQIQHVFGVSGANIEHLFYAITRCEGMEAILAKHESNAVTMAEGHFRKTGKPGVAMVTSGGGAHNTLASLSEAYESEIPMLLIVGQIAMEQEGGGGFQDSSGGSNRINSIEVFTPFSLKTIKLTEASQLIPSLNELFELAVEHRGPTVLLVPRNLWDKPVFDIKPPTLKVVQAKLDIGQEVTELFSSATRPLVIVGKDAIYRGLTEELRKLIEVTNALVALTPDAKGFWDHEDARFVGILGIMGHQSVEAAIADSDLLITVGTRLPTMSRPLVDGLKNKALISICSSPLFINESYADGLNIFEVRDLSKETLTHLIESCYLAETSRSMSRKRYVPEPLSIPLQALPRSVGSSIPMRYVIEQLASFFQNSDVFVDAGNVGAAAVHYFKSRGGSLFSVALGMGGMGHSFGASIGSCMVDKRRSLVIAGDGAFFMSGMEIHTAWQYKLPITFVIFNNNSHGMCHIREKLYLGTPSGDNLFEMSYIGKSMAALLPGLPAFDLQTAAELDQTLDALKNSSGPAVISVSIDPEETPPFRPFLAEKA